MIMRFGIRGILAVFAGLALLIGVTSHAEAVLTTVANPHSAQPGNPGEWNLFDNGSGKAGIMEFLYGTGNFVRVDDDFDKVWMKINGAGATGISKFAGASQQLGFRQGGSDTLLSPVISINIVPPTTTAISSAGIPSGLFNWLDAATGATNVGTQYSDPALNSDAGDHMVTFKILKKLGTPGNPATAAAVGVPTFVIGFEDRILTGTPPLADKDYDDLVVEVTNVRPVAEPGTLGLTAIGMFGLVWLGWRRSRRTG